MLRRDFMKYLGYAMASISVASPIPALSETPMKTISPSAQWIRTFGRVNVDLAVRVSEAGFKFTADQWIFLIDA